MQTGMGAHMTFGNIYVLHTFGRTGVGNSDTGHSPMNAEMMFTSRESTASANQTQHDACKTGNMLPNWLPLGGLVGRMAVHETR